jgi:hypothetical protein
MAKLTAAFPDRFYDTIDCVSAIVSKLQYLSDILLSNDRFFEMMASFRDPSGEPPSEADMQKLEVFLLDRSSPLEIQNYRAIGILMSRVIGHYTQELHLVGLFLKLAQSSINKHEMHRGKLLFHVLERLPAVSDLELRRAYCTLFQDVSSTFFPRNVLWRSVTVLNDPHYSHPDELLSVFLNLMVPHPKNFSPFFKFGRGCGSSIHVPPLTVPHRFTIQLYLRILAAKSDTFMPFLIIELKGIDKYSFGVEGGQLCLKSNRTAQTELLPLTFDRWHEIQIVFEQGLMGIFGSRQISVTVDDRCVTRPSYTAIQGAVIGNRLAELWVGGYSDDLPRPSISCDISAVYLLAESNHQTFFPTDDVEPDPRMVVCCLNPIDVHGSALHSIASSLPAVPVGGRIVPLLEPFDEVFCGLSTVWNFLPLFRRLSKSEMELDSGTLFFQMLIQLFAHLAGRKPGLFEDEQFFPVFAFYIADVPDQHIPPRFFASQQLEVFESLSETGGWQW